MVPVNELELKTITETKLNVETTETSSNTFRTLERSQISEVDKMSAVPEQSQANTFKTKAALQQSQANRSQSVHQKTHRNTFKTQALSQKSKANNKNASHFELQHHRVLPTLLGNYPLRYAYGFTIANQANKVLVLVADNSQGFKVLDYTNPNSPTFISMISTVGKPMDVAAQGTLAYVADSDAGMQIIDFSNPAALTLRGRLDSPSLSNTVIVSGTRAITGDVSIGVRIINVLDPAAPTLLGSYNFASGTTMGLALGGSNILYFADGVSNLHILDITTPAAIVVKSIFPTQGLASRVAINANTAWVTAGYNLDAIDVTVSTSPSLKARKTTSHLLRSLDITPAASHAYVISYSDGVEVYDIRNTSSIDLAGVYSLPSSRAIKINGNSVLVASEGSGITALQKQKIIPKKIALIDTPASTQSVAFSNNLALVVDYPNGLSIVDLTVPETPVTLSSFPVPNAITVAVSGSIAFLSSQANGIAIVNFSNPSNPSLIGYFDTAGSAFAMAMMGNFGFIADSSNGMPIVDFTNLASPVLLSTFPTPATSVLEVRVDSNNNLAFLGTSNSFKIVDVLNKAAPTLKSSFPLSTYPYGIAIDSTRKIAYLANFENGIKIIDYSNELSPVLLNTFDVGGTALAAKIVNNYLYVAAYLAGMQVYDVQNAAIPEWMGEYREGGSLYDIAISGRRAALANGVNGFVVLDEVIPSAEPVIINNVLLIHKGQTIKITRDILNFGDIDNATPGLIIDASSITHGFIDLSTNTGKGITKFTLADVDNGLVRFTHDNTNFAPTLSFTANDGYGAIPVIPAATTVTFVTVPPIFVNNKMTMNQGELVVVKTTDIQATTAGKIDPLLIFTPSNTNHVQFEQADNPNVAIGSFTQLDVQNNKIRLRHDNTKNPGSYQLSVSIVSLISAPQSAVVTYINRNDSPQIVNNKLTINEQETRTVTPSNFLFTDLDGNEGNLRVTFSSQHGNFRSIPQNKIITECLQSNITAGHIQVSHDGTEQAFSGFVSVSDGTFNIGPQPIDVTFLNTNDAPQLTANQIPITEGGTLAITTSHFNANDPDNTPDQITFTILNAQHIQIERRSAPGVAVTEFTLLEVQQNVLIAKHDGSEFAPTLDTVVSDGEAATTAAAATITYTPVNNMPVFINNTVDISEGQSLILTPAHLSAIDSDTPLGSLRFLMSGEQNCRFERISAPGTATHDFTQQEVIDGQIRLVHLGGQTTLNYLVSITDGSLTTAPQAPTVLYTPVNNTPQLTANQIPITEGGTLAITTSHFNAIDLDNMPDQITFTISNAQHIQIERRSAPGVAVTEFTLLEVQQNVLIAKHDGSEFAPTLDTVVSDGEAATIAAAATITYTPVNNMPVFINNTVAISEGQSLILTPAHLSAIDSDTPLGSLRFLMSGEQNCRFERISAPGTATHDFTQQEVIDGQIRLVHLGGQTTLNYLVSITDGSLTTAPQAPTVLYTPVNNTPQLTANQIPITEGGTLAITTSHFNANDPDNTPDQITFTILNAQHIQIERRSAPGVAVTEFTLLEVQQNVLIAKHDGSEFAPTLDTVVSDGEAATTAAAATITYTPVNNMPVFINNTVDISEGQSLILTPAHLSAIDSDTPLGSLRFLMSGEQNCRFERISAPGIAIHDFTQQEIIDGQIRLVHLGGQTTLNYLVSITDGSLTTVPQAPTVLYTPVNNTPQLTANQIPITEGGTLAITTSHFNAIDLDNMPDQITFTILNAQHIQIERRSAPGVAVTEFTLLEVQQNVLIAKHDGSEFAPTLDTVVSDGEAATIAAAATITYTPVNNMPVFINNTVAISEGQSLILTPAHLSAIDSDTPLGSLRFLMSGEQNCRFERISAPGTAIHDFTQQEVIDEQIRLVHLGDQTTLNYLVSITDGSLTTVPQAPTVLYTPVNNTPQLTANQIPITEGGTLAITTSHFNANDPDNTPDQITFTILNAQHIQIERRSAPGVAVTKFTLLEVQQNVLIAKHDGSEFAPTLDIVVSDGEAATTAAAATITYTPVNNRPEISVNDMTLREGGRLRLDGSNIAFKDRDSNEDELEISFDDATHVRFSDYNDDSVEINTVVQSALKAGAVEIIHDGSNNAPSCTLKANDGFNSANGLDSAKSQCNIKFIPVNDAPISVVNDFTIDTDQSGAVVTSDEIAFTDEETPSGELDISVKCDNLQFEYLGNSGVKVDHFKQNRIENSALRVVPIGPPPYACNITASDGESYTNSSSKITVLDRVKTQDPGVNWVNIGIGLGVSAAGSLFIYGVKKGLDYRIANATQEIIKRRAKDAHGELGTCYRSHFAPILTILFDKIGTTSCLGQRSPATTESYIRIFESIIEKLALVDYPLSKFGTPNQQTLLANIIVNEIKKIVRTTRPKCCSCSRLIKCCCQPEISIDRFEEILTDGMSKAKIDAMIASKTLFKSEVGKTIIEIIARRVEKQLKAAESKISSDDNKHRGDVKEIEMGKVRMQDQERVHLLQEHVQHQDARINQLFQHLNLPINQQPLEIVILPQGNLTPQSSQGGGSASLKYVNIQSSQGVMNMQGLHAARTPRMEELLKRMDEVEVQQEGIESRIEIGMPE